jgi:hypothetical protein
VLILIEGIEILEHFLGHILEFMSDGANSRTVLVQYVAQSDPPLKCIVSPSPATSSIPSASSQAVILRPTK